VASPLKLKAFFVEFYFFHALEVSLGTIEDKVVAYYLNWVVIVDNDLDTMDKPEVIPNALFRYFIRLI
jgi:hypothetical protein